MPRSTPCKFHQAPDGCRKGDSCNFLHTGPSGGSARRQPGVEGGSVSTTGGATSPARRPAVTTVPPGVCRDFWVSGQCKKSFECRFRHVKEPPPAKEQLRTNTVASTSSATQTSGLNPTQVHNHLEKFMRDSYRFRTPNEIYLFASLLNHARVENDWTVDDGQLLLTALSKAGNNGLLRLGDIIRHPDIVFNAGVSPGKLSYQRSYIPLLSYFSSEFVVKSTMNYNVNALYALIHNDFDSFSRTIQKCMDDFIANKSFHDPLYRNTSYGKEILGSRVFSSLCTVLYEYLTRFKTPIIDQSRSLVHSMSGWFDQWTSGITSTPPTFEDAWAEQGTSQSRSFIISRLRQEVSRVVTIVDREQAGHLRRALPNGGRSISDVDNPRSRGILAYLETHYVGPGEVREGGPRHDNDFADITQISIAPTHQELTSPHPPFLPANIPNAPHHLPAASMEKLLDIQFRLLREELISSVRIAVQLVLKDLQTVSTKSMLSEILRKRGGRYIGGSSDRENLMFNIYTNCRFLKIHMHTYRGVVVDVGVDAPPGSARSRNPSVRANFWEGRGGRRLMQGGLVALVLGTGGNASVHLGILASPSKDIADSARQSQEERIRLQISFFDPQAELHILRSMKNPQLHHQESRLLIEASVIFETVRPFLDAIRAEPTSLPFSRYLVHPLSGNLTSMKIEPPKYALDPLFSFDLRCLFRDNPPETLCLRVTESSDIDACRQELCMPNSRLDSSQAGAVVDTLTREIALIQGPPGTGKTYIGVEIIRVLLKNHVGPILMIAYTNHALDHMLSAILEASITKKIVRLGTRSTDEQVSEFSLENLATVHGESKLDQILRTEFRRLKGIERDMDALMNRVRAANVAEKEIQERFIRFQYPDQYESLLIAPYWLEAARNLDKGWEIVGGSRGDGSSFSHWESGLDLKFLTAREEYHTSRNQNQNNANVNRFAALGVDAQETSEGSESADSDSESQPDSDSNSSLDIGKGPMNEHLWTTSSGGFAASWMKNWFPIDEDSISTLEDEADNTTLTMRSETSESVSPYDIFGPEELPQLPKTDRPLNQLLEPSLDVWSISMNERTRLARYWRDGAHKLFEKEHLDEFSRLRTKYEGARKYYNEIRDQTKIHLLKNSDVVGCTTTGAAKFNTLLKSLSPRVLLVEEAGQVLEAHVLGSLVSSVEHLILIGDPLQLRPNLANFGLSVDSKRGEALYRFDVSLMERLSSFGLRMSQLEVQRRMRPCIAQLVRASLYPRLQDHDLTSQYPPVRGMAKDLFFMSHEHRETGGGEDSVSKHNMFEVKMAVDLVMHFLKQGSYSDDGDIVILCAYLGQLVQMRDALKGKVVTLIDERDQESLAAHEEDREDVPESSSSFEQVAVAKKVLLRTVDNYQGEEAKIIILSLVRNSGPVEDEQTGTISVLRPTIGFLKSRNRTNVALSRAKHGLYILGNATNLVYHSPMWKNVIDVLDEQGALGSGFPISCAKHPEECHDISEPGKIALYSPDGGCLRPCSEPLRCGHICPYKCHSDDENHRLVSCNQRCLRLCPKGHPCNKLCSEKCGNCQHPIPNVELPCGHTMLSVECHLENDLGRIKCPKRVDRKHQTCEHMFTIACGEDPSLSECEAPCDVNLLCCGRRCTSYCGECQSLNRSETTNNTDIVRQLHKPHPCRRTLFCGHFCKRDCSGDHTCTSQCLERCRQACEHNRCKKPCSVVCAPCAQPCSWACPHQGQCPVPCGSVCARLPCDIRCSKVLDCGHRCPSLCGEPCSICIVCAPADRKKDIVDFVMQRTLEDLVPTDSLDSLIFTLSCGHTFTVETLDGVCDLKQFYRHSDDKWLGLATPPGLKKTPVCPTCRFPIDIPRYGRTFKRSSLDLAERNVALDMSRSLEEVRNRLQGFDQTDAQTALDQAVRTHTCKTATISQDERNKIQQVYAKLLERTPDKPIAGRCFDLPGNKPKKNVHFVAPGIAAAWKEATKPLMRAYTSAIEIAERRVPHTVAYENAFSTLYRAELDNLTCNSAAVPREPTENAMRMARFRIGQPPPRADKRYIVEALWLSINLRLLMGKLAETALEVMIKSHKCPREPYFWSTFIRFIYVSCCRDNKLAQRIAQDSESHRQVVDSCLRVLRTEFELFRFDAKMSTQSRHLTGAEREDLLREVNTKIQSSRQFMRRTREEYLAARSGNDEESWFLAHFTEPALKILDQLVELENSVKSGVTYQPVSEDELVQIVGAFNYTHTGHWYQCPNGHMYTIGDCGGAMQEGRCPECGHMIGGTNHTLNATSTQARNMEDIGRRQGAQPSPWAWGPDA